MLVAVLAGCASVSQPPPPLQATAAASTQEGAPVTIPRAKQYDITSRINDQTYRIMVATPFMADSAMVYPVLYVLDGNSYFGTATDAMAKQSVFKNVSPAIVVGIGYPTEDPKEVLLLRLFDLTPSASADPKEVRKCGGGDAFLRVLEEEIKPFIMAHYRVDAAKQIIWGHSLGGLMILRALFRNPNAFSTYILSSPSIWWNYREVLVDEEAFSKRARAGELQLKVLVTSAGDEQYRGNDPCWPQKRDA